MGKSPPIQMRKTYEELGENNWLSYNINNEAILRPVAKHVPERLKIEEKEQKRKVLKQLGLVEKVDRTGKVVLQNCKPLKTHMTQKEVAALIGRLAEKKT